MWPDNALQAPMVIKGPDNRSYKALGHFAMVIVRVSQWSLSLYQRQSMVIISVSQWSLSALVNGRYQR